VHAFASGEAYVSALASKAVPVEDVNLAEFAGRRHLMSASRT